MSEDGKITSPINSDGSKLKKQIEDKIKQVEAASTSLGADFSSLETLLFEAEKASVDQDWLNGIRARVAEAKKKLSSLSDRLKARRNQSSVPPSGNDPSTPRTPKP